MTPEVSLITNFLLPLWLLAGFADWLCHRATSIESTTGTRESVLHLVMFAEIGPPVLGALFLDVNALVFAILIAGFVLHQATAFWDVAYSEKLRRISPLEQQVHSFLEVIPLTIIVLFASAHWGQFRALFGFGNEAANFALRWQPAGVSGTYIAALAIAIVLLELAPYLEELLRGLRAKRDGSGELPARALPRSLF